MKDAAELATYKCDAQQLPTMNRHVAGFDGGAEAIFRNLIERLNGDISTDLQHRKPARKLTGFQALMNIFPDLSLEQIIDLICSVTQY